MANHFGPISGRPYSGTIVDSYISWIPFSTTLTADIEPQYSTTTRERYEKHDGKILNYIHTDQNLVIDDQILSLEFPPFSFATFYDHSKAWQAGRQGGRTFFSFSNLSTMII